MAGEIIKKIYLDGVCSEIYRVMSNPHDGKKDCGGIGHIVLISICCAIDSISAYRLPDASFCDDTRKFLGCSGYPRDFSSYRFQHFIKNYFDSQYNEVAAKIYKAFRCSSVHGWNLHSSSISGKKNDDMHLNVHGELIHLSLYDFFDDFQKAVTKYISDLANPQIIGSQINAFKWRYCEEVKDKPVSVVSRSHELAPFGVTGQCSF